MESGKARIQCCQPAAPPARKFGKPRIGDLRAPLQMAVRDVEKIQRIAPPYMFWMGSDLSQRLPCRCRARVNSGSHMQTQQCSLREDARGETVPTLQRTKPIMDAVVMHVRIQPERNEHIPVQQPRQVSSFSASI